MTTQMTNTQKKVIKQLLDLETSVSKTAMNLKQERGSNDYVQDDITLPLILLSDCEFGGLGNYDKDCSSYNNQLTKSNHYVNGFLSVECAKATQTFFDKVKAICSTKNLLKAADPKHLTINQGDTVSLTQKILLKYGGIKNGPVANLPDNEEFRRYITGGEYSYYNLELFDKEGSDLNKSTFKAGDLVNVTFLLKVYNYNKSGVKMIPQAVQLVKPSFITKTEADNQLQESKRTSVKRRRLNIN